MKVRFNANKATGEYPSLTHGKIYEVEEIIEMTYDDSNEKGLHYMLYEDDHDEQEPYEVDIFDIVEE